MQGSRRSRRLAVLALLWRLAFPAFVRSPVVPVKCSERREKLMQITDVQLRAIIPFDMTMTKIGNTNVKQKRGRRNFRPLL